jgi:hypothetical protein
MNRDDTPLDPLKGDVRSSSHAPVARSHLVEQPREPASFTCTGAWHGVRRFSRALHKIKAAGDLSGSDRVVIYSDGSVTDEQGEPLGNLHDED